MVLTRQQIIDAVDADYEQFEVPMWGMVRIRSLSAAERLDLAESVSEKSLTPSELFGFYAQLIAHSLVDDAGRELFDAENVEDLRLIQDKSWNRLEEVGKRILKFNAMGTGDEGSEKN